MNSQNEQSNYFERGKTQTNLLQASEEGNNMFANIMRSSQLGQLGLS